VHLDDETREAVCNILRSRIATVSFTKKDNTKRILKCTLDENIIPSTRKESNNVRVVNPEVCRVWDVENQAWRSFRWESITKLEV
jgi:hypothetical protein